jgi:hypothetical protein
MTSTEDIVSVSHLEAKLEWITIFKPMHSRGLLNGPPAFT